MPDRAWSLDLKPIYDNPEGFDNGFINFTYPSVLRAVRVAIKYGDTEVLTFHAVRPVPSYLGPDEKYVYSWRAVLDENDKIMDFNPLEQMLADAEVGRKIREAGLELT